MRIVLICPSGSVGAALDRFGVDPATTGEEVIVVSGASLETPLAPLIRTIVLSRPLKPAAQRAAAFLSRSTIGRNLLRLSPLDGGRRLARSARRSAEFSAAVADADLIGALERDGILTAWQAAHTSAPSTARAVYGVSATEAFLRQLRARA